MSDSKGTLIIVPTPIGNLADMSARAVKALQDADLIAAEDTRTSRPLLNEYAITTPVTSYHDFSSDRSRNRLLSRLSAGETVALISDAGTPGISDPAYRLVEGAISMGATVVPLPGPTSIIPALVGSGLPTDAFRYIGFLPRKKGRQTTLTELVESKETTVFLESPHRLQAALDWLAEHAPDRLLCTAREISKLHEDFQRGTTCELCEHFKEAGIRGEFVLVMEGAKAAKKRLRRAAEAAEAN
jgi:16S rRNA (cytidine1402-2'-O)-methyltransferase